MVMSSEYEEIVNHLFFSCPVADLQEHFGFASVCRIRVDFFQHIFKKKKKFGGGGKLE